MAKINLPKDPIIVKNPTWKVLLSNDEGECTSLDFNSAETAAAYVNYVNNSSCNVTAEMHKIEGK